jgi:hypothetical protein
MTRNPKLILALIIAAAGIAGILTAARLLVHLNALVS